jgi:hypothetical protein
MSSPDNEPENSRKRPATPEPIATSSPPEIKLSPATDQGSASGTLQIAVQAAAKESITDLADPFKDTPSVAEPLSEKAQFEQRQARKIVSVLPLRITLKAEQDANTKPQEAMKARNKVLEAEVEALEQTVAAAKAKLK